MRLKYFPSCKIVHIVSNGFLSCPSLISDLKFLDKKIDGGKPIGAFLSGINGYLTSCESIKIP